MLQCKKCGADLSGGEVKHGISKDKTMPDGTFRPGGKPYKYVMCSCGNREFLPFGVAEKKPSVPVSKPNPVVTDQKYLVEINGMLVKVLDKLAKIEARVVSVEKLVSVKDLIEEVNGEIVDPSQIAWEE